MLDVTTFGGLPGGTDAYPGIQAAVNAACAQASEADAGDVPPVFLPVGTYSITQPINLSCAGSRRLELYGASRSSTIIRPQGGLGPAIFMASPGDDIPLVAPLVGTTGQAMSTGYDAGVFGRSSFFLNLRDIPSVELDGLSAFTAETFVEVTSPVAAEAAEGFIVGGSTPYCTFAFPDYTVGPAFSLLLTFGQFPAGTMNIAGSSLQVVGATPLDVGTVHHLALAYDAQTSLCADGAACSQGRACADGSACSPRLRLYVDGAIAASTPASGAIRQDVVEDVMVGPQMCALETWGPEFATFPGVIDSLRLSNVARYTAAFAAPTAKLANDANTLALLNFNSQAPGLTLADTKDGPVWLPVKRTFLPDGNYLPGLSGIMLHDFAVSGGSGIVGWGAVAAQVRQIDCLGCDLGFDLDGTTTPDLVDGVSASAGPRGRFGLVGGSNSNGDGYQNVTLSGQMLPFLSLNGYQDVTSHLAITAGPHTVRAVTLVYAVEHAFDGLTVDATQAGPAWRGAISATQPYGKLVVQSSVIGNAGSGVPISLLGSFGGSVGAIVQDTQFTGTAGAPEILHVGAPTSHSSIVSAATKDSTVPWSDDADLVTLASDPPFTSPIATSRLPSLDLLSTVVSGQVASSRVFDITAFGARAGQDSTAAVQAAVDAACAQGGSTSTVFVPVGTFPISQPVLVRCDGVTVEGAGRTTSILQATGPTLAQTAGFVVEPAGMTGVNRARALVEARYGQSGDAMRTDGSSWIELRDAQSVELEGLQAFTAEAFIRVCSTPAGYAGIVQSHGCLGSRAPLPGCTSAFALAMSGPNLIGSMSLGGAAYALQGPPVSLGAVHHVALQYDGTTVQLLLDGARVDVKSVSSAAGTPPSIDQGPHEDVTIGPRTTGFDAAIAAPAIPGAIDSVRLSNAAVYPAVPFAPPRNKLTPSASTLVLENFDSAPPGVALALDAAGHALWLPVRRTAEPNGIPEGTLTGVTFRDLRLDAASPAIFGMNATNGRYLGVSADSDEGIVLDGDSSGSRFDDFEATGAGRARYGLVTVHGDGNLTLNPVLAKQTIPLVVAGGSSQTFFHVLLVPSSRADWGAIFDGAGAAVYGMWFLTQGARSDLAVVDPAQPLELVQGGFDMPTPIVLDGGQGLALVGTAFTATAPSSPLVTVVTPPTGALLGLGVSADSTAALSNWPGAQSIGD